MADVAIKNLGMVYTGGTRALFDFSLEVKEGEFFALLGPESAGKSTVLRTVAGLEDPTEGEILLGGKSMDGVVPKDRNLAMIFPGGVLYPNLTVQENLGYGLKLRKAPPAVIERRVQDVAALLGLQSLLSKRPKQLTAAQRQRVALGRSIAREPDLFLFDEPFGGLDDALRLSMVEELVRLHIRLRKTFLYATENVAEAMTVGDRVGVMKDGFLLQVDSPANLYEYPANLFVADMVGGISFTRGAHIVSGEEGYAVEAEGERIPLGALKERIKDFGAYADTGREVILAYHNEDATLDENGARVGLDASRLLLFDGETERTLLSHDDGYDKSAGGVDMLPPTVGEMRNAIEDAKPKKTKKSKK